jgi:hypothetical protein
MSRGRRLSRRLGVAALVALAVIALTAAPAGAQSPTDNPLNLRFLGVNCTPPHGIGDIGGESDPLHDATGVYGAMNGDSGRVEDDLRPEAFVIYYDPDKDNIDAGPFHMDNPARAALATFANLPFTAANWLVRIAGNVTTWAFRFEIAKNLGDEACQVAVQYHNSVVWRLGLVGFFMVLAAAYGGWHALRGRLTHGAAELGLSLVFFALLGTVAMKPLESFNWSFNLIGELSTMTLTTRPGQPVDPCAGNQGRALDLCRTAAQQDATSSIDAVKPILFETLIGEPYDVLNWGQVIGPPARGRDCASARHAILAGRDDGSLYKMGDFDDIKDRLEDMGGLPSHCVTDFQHAAEDPDMERMIGAVETLVVSLFVVALIILVALTVLAAQFEALLLLAISPIGLVLGLLPGGGRHLFWRFIFLFIQALATTLVMAMLLSFLVWTSDAILSATEGQNLMVRFVEMLGLVVLLFSARQRVKHSVQMGLRRAGVRMDWPNHRPYNKADNLFWMAPHAPEPAPWGISHPARKGIQGDVVDTVISHPVLLGAATGATGWAVRGIMGRHLAQATLGPAGGGGGGGGGAGGGGSGGGGSGGGGSGGGGVGGGGSGGGGGRSLGSKAMTTAMGGLIGAGLGAAAGGPIGGAMGQKAGAAAAGYLGARFGASRDPGSAVTSVATGAARGAVRGGAKGAMIGGFVAGPAGAVGVGAVGAGWGALRSGAGATIHALSNRS